jgi:hypothetical protein
MPKHTSEFMIAMTLLAVAHSQRHLIAEQHSSVLIQRPLTLPSIHPGDSCTIAVGSRGTVPNQNHIFGASGAWFGAGPMYVALPYRFTRDDNNATFSLDQVPLVDGVHRAKTPWVSVPSYSGAILIRGLALDAGGGTLRFSASGAGPRDSLYLEVPQARSAGLWSFWASSMWVPSPGCYGIQIDTLAGTDIVIFSAT